MTYFCFLESEHASISHMEPLDAETVEQAAAQARHVLELSHTGIAAHVFLDNVPVLTIRRAERANDR